MPLSAGIPRSAYSKSPPASPRVRSLMTKLPGSASGMSEPLRTFRVVGSRAIESRFEATRSDAALTPLVGREEEIALVLRRWQQVGAAEWTAATVRQQLHQTDDKRGRIDRHCLRSGRAEGEGKLDQDRSGQRLVSDLPLLWTRRAVFRQDVEARGHRCHEMNLLSKIRQERNRQIGGRTSATGSFCVIRRTSPDAPLLADCCRSCCAGRCMKVHERHSTHIAP